MRQKSATDVDRLVWAWAFPIVYAIHLVEEGWSGTDFPHWMASQTGYLMPHAVFLGLNGLGLAAMVAATWAGQKWREARWLLVCVAAAALVNGILHLLGSLWTESISPGLFTGLFVWAPLGAFALARLRAITERRYALGLATGILINGFVVWLAMAGVASRVFLSSASDSTASSRRLAVGTTQKPAESKNSANARAVFSSNGS